MVENEELCIRLGSMQKLIKKVYFTKGNRLCAGTNVIMTKFAEAKVKEILDFACDLANADNRKTVTISDLTRAMEKYGVDIVPFLSVQVIEQTKEVIVDEKEKIVTEDNIDIEEVVTESQTEEIVKTEDKMETSEPEKEDVVEEEIKEGA